MKTTLNAKELCELDACEERYDVFYAAHGEKTVTLSQALTSNGWDDIWWYISETHDKFSDSQNRDFRLLACRYAEDVLSIFESEFPDDQRPRAAIATAIKFADGISSKEELAAAMAAAWAAAWAARDAAWAAAWAARDAAWAARDAAKAAWTARDAVRAARAAGDAAMSAGGATKEWQKEKLMDLFLKWESEQ